MPIESNKQLVLQLIEDFWNQGNLTAADDLVASAVLRESMKNANSLFHDVFSDLCFEPQELIGEEDKVVARYLMSGSYVPRWFGLARPARPFAIDYIAIYRFSESKIKGFVFLRDNLVLLRQLGLPAVLNILLRYGKRLGGV